MAINVNGKTLTSVKVGSTTVHKVNVITDSSTGAYVTVFDDSTGTVSYTVRYYDGSSFLTSEEVISGQQITKTLYSKSGYSFDGWYTDSSLTTSFNNSTPITSNLDLYGKWTKSSSGGDPEPTYQYPDFSDFTTDKFCTIDYANELIPELDSYDSEADESRKIDRLSGIIPELNSRMIFLLKTCGYAIYNKEYFSNSDININSSGALIHSENFSFQDSNFYLEAQKSENFSDMAELLVAVAGCRKDSPFYGNIYECCFEPIVHYSGGSSESSWYTKDIIQSITYDPTTCTVMLNSNNSSNFPIGPDYVNFFNLPSILLNIGSGDLTLKSQYYERVFNIVTVASSDDTEVTFTTKNDINLTQDQWNEVLSEIIPIRQDFIDGNLKSPEELYGTYYIRTFDDDHLELVPNSSSKYYNSTLPNLLFYTNFSADAETIKMNIETSESLYIGAGIGPEEFLPLINDGTGTIDFKTTSYNRCYYLTIDGLADPASVYNSHNEFLTAIEAAVDKENAILKVGLGDFIGKTSTSTEIHDILPDCLSDIFSAGNDYGRYIQFNEDLLKYFHNVGGETSDKGYVLGTSESSPQPLINARQNAYETRLQYTNLTYVESSELPFLTINYYQYESNYLPVDLGLIRNNTYHFINTI